MWYLKLQYQGALPSCGRLVIFARRHRSHAWQRTHLYPRHEEPEEGPLLRGRGTVGRFSWRAVIRPTSSTSMPRCRATSLRERKRLPAGEM